ncbi:MAG: hypothetical protein ABJA61_05485 [Caldimonas sp.]
MSTSMPTVARNDAPISFDAAATTTCRLVDGPTLDLDLLLREATGWWLEAQGAEATQ